jgi:hypothetical protein
MDFNPTDTKATGQVCSAGPLKQALASIPDACKYMGHVSRAKFYSDVLPLLETVHIGTRHFVVVASMDRLISKLKDAPATAKAPARTHHSTKDQTWEVKPREQRSKAAGIKY